MERDQLVDQVQLVAVAVGVPDFVVDDAEPVAFNAGETTMKPPFRRTGQIESGLDDVPRASWGRANSWSSRTETAVSTGLRPWTLSPSRTVNGLLSAMDSCQGRGCLRPAKGEFVVALVGKLGTIRSGCCGGQSPRVIDAVGGADQAADASLTVVHDCSELRMSESVSTELAACGQEGHRLPGRVVPVGEIAVHLGRFEKLPIHSARIYQSLRTHVRFDACGGCC